jgi:SAM-dependent methyltransferase
VFDQLVGHRPWTAQTGRVLDVGCGNQPLPWATHLADLSITDHSQRFGQSIPAGLRPLVQCSVEALPFADKSFAFVRCTHVLEHVANPAAACEELSRVGLRGYIECPRSWVEYVFSAVGHRWLVDAESGVLIFREKAAREYKDPLGIRDALLPRLGRDAAFARHWNSASVRAVRNVEYRWTDRVRYLVLRAGERSSSARSPRVGAVTVGALRPAAGGERSSG